MGKLFMVRRQIEIYEDETGATQVVPTGSTAPKGAKKVELRDAYPSSQALAGVGELGKTGRLDLADAMAKLRIFRDEHASKMDRVYSLRPRGLQQVYERPTEMETPDAELRERSMKAIIDLKGEFDYIEEKDEKPPKKKAKE